MRTPQQITHLDTAAKTLDQIVSAVVERGYDDRAESVDDYGVLLAGFEHRKLVTFQLYDSYFPPKRHEFELQLLTSLVDAVATNPTVAFVGGAVAGGVVGNAAYDVLKHLLARLVSKLKPIKRSHNAFREIEKNTDRIVRFFQTRNQAGITEICEALDTDPDKVEPLLKLLGFSCRRKGKRRVWIAPMYPRTKENNRSKPRES
jgi:hypothetical protein